MERHSRRRKPERGFDDEVQKDAEEFYEVSDDPVDEIIELPEEDSAPLDEEIVIDLGEKPETAVTERPEVKQNIRTDRTLWNKWRSAGETAEEAPAEVPDEEAAASEAGSAETAPSDAPEEAPEPAHVPAAAEAAGTEAGDQPDTGDQPEAGKKPKRRTASGKAGGEKKNSAKGKDVPVRKRSKLGKAISCVCFLALLGVVLFYLTRVVEYRDGIDKMRPFVELETSPDVLFFGTSHTTYGIMPVELYEDYGIASYNLGSSKSTMAMNYWLIQEALDISTPKLVVVDCSRYRLRLKTPDDFGMLHQAFDAFPLNTTKIMAIDDLLDEPYLDLALEAGEVTEAELEERDKYSLYFNFLTYHSRWPYLKLSDLELEYNKMKGGDIRTTVAENNIFPQLKATLKLGYDAPSEVYLRKIVDLCRSRGVEILFTYLPYSANNTRQREAHSAVMDCEEIGVPMINFLDLNIVDYVTDSADVGSHLNASGARKVTDYIGKYITENYAIPDRRGEEVYASWEEDRAGYEDYKNRLFAKTDDLNSYLMLLMDPDYDCVIETGNALALKEGKTPSFLRNIGIEPDDIAEDTQYILVEGGKKSTILYECRGDGEKQKTVLGEFRSVYAEGVDARYSLNGIVMNEDDVVGAEISPEDSVVRICVMKHGNPEAVIDRVEFKFSMKNLASSTASRSSRRAVFTEDELDAEKTGEAGSDAESVAEPVEDPAAEAVEETEKEEPETEEAEEQKEEKTSKNNKKEKSGSDENPDAGEQDKIETN